MRSYTWVSGSRWRGPWGRCLSAAWWTCSPATQHRDVVPLLCILVVVYYFWVCENDWNWHICSSETRQSGYSQPLSPGQSRNSESSRHTACSWASRAPRRSHWCTRLSHLWARHGRECLASPGCHWFQGYPPCQGCLPGPASKCHTVKKQKREELRVGVDNKKKAKKKQKTHLLTLLLSNFLFHIFSILPGGGISPCLGLMQHKHLKSCHSSNHHTQRSQIKPHLPVP